jgi:PPM family protein phosphatase
MVMKLMPYKVTTYGLSEIGLVRQNNEDSWAIIPEINFYALADGMGGHNAGEVASREAIKAVCEHFQQTLQIAGSNLSIEEAHGLIQLAIEHANDVVYGLSRTDMTLQGMGTTLCCIYCHPKGLIYAHVGDSRIYKFTRGTLEQITKDHSLLRELVDMGQINEHQAGEFIYKNIITKAIGTESVIEPTVNICDAVTGDVYLICSDGLSDMLTINEMEAILSDEPDIKKATKKLITEAINKGGFDNVTILTLKVNEVYPS